MSPLEAMIEALVAVGVELHFARLSTGAPSLMAVRDGAPTIFSASTAVLDLVHEACAFYNINPEEIY